MTVSLGNSNTYKCKNALVVWWLGSTEALVSYLLETSSLNIYFSVQLNFLMRKDEKSYDMFEDTKWSNQKPEIEAQTNEKGQNAKQ